MSQLQGLADLTLLSAREAVQEYFAPLRGLARWLHDFRRMPGILVGAARDIAVMALHQERQLSALHYVEQTVGSVLRDLRHLDSELGTFRAEHREQLPLLVRGLETHLLSFERNQAERTVAKYLSFAGDLRRRGELSHATHILSLLRDVGERHNLQSVNYVWFNLGELLFEKRDLSAAEDYFDRVVHRGEIDEVVAAAYSRLAFVHYYRHHFDKTQQFASEALRLFQRSGNKQAISHTYMQMASALAAQGAAERAAQALDKATQAAGEITAFLLPER